MKTTMKKLLSFVLVAMLLVTAIPFQASALTANSDGVVTVPVEVVNQNGGHISNKDLQVKDTVYLNKALAETLVNSWTNRTYSGWQKADGSAITDGQALTSGWLQESAGDSYSLKLVLNVTESTTATTYEESPVQVPVYVYINGSKVNTTKTLTLSSGETVELTNSLAMSMLNTTDGRTFVKWENNSGDNVTGKSLSYEWVNKQSGYYLNMYLTEGSSSSTTSTSTTYTLTINYSGAYSGTAYLTGIEAGKTVTAAAITEAVQDNVGISNLTTSANDMTISGDTTVSVTVTEVSSKYNSNKVYLHIFLNNDLTEPAKSINITSGIALDYKVTMAEVKTVVKNYYTAKTSDGIGYDGLYYSTGSWTKDFLNDSNKSDTVTGIQSMLEDGYVHINVVISNATAKDTSSSSTADSTNPKTGDTIYTTATVMTVSACALALVYFFSKKRAVR